MKKIVLDEFSEYVKYKRKKVRIVVRSMTKEEARRVFPYRPFSKYAESRFGGNIFVDDILLLINSNGKRCSMCSAPTKNDYLIRDICPDCDGRSELNGGSPRKK